MNNCDEKHAIISALRAWVKQRPGLDPRNYGDSSSYRSEQRSITQDKKDAWALITAVDLSDRVTSSGLKAAFRAFSGRLQWDGKSLDYCTGQYWPTEYRKAVCAVCAAALWDAFISEHAGEDRPGILAREYFKEAYGPRLAKRWFD